MAELQNSWDLFQWTQGSRYPFSFTGKEREEIEADAEGAFLGIGAMTGLMEALGELAPLHGIVRPEQYDEAMDELRQMKEQAIEKFARTEEDKQEWERLWPFDS